MCVWQVIFRQHKNTHTQPRNYDIMIWNCCLWKRWWEISGAPTENQLRATIVLLSTEAAKKKSDRNDAGQFLPGLPRLNSAMWRKQPRPGEPESRGAAGCCPQRPLAKLTSPAWLRHVNYKWNSLFLCHFKNESESRKDGGWSPIRAADSREDQTRLLFLYSILKFRQEISLSFQPLADRNQFGVYL